MHQSRILKIFLIILVLGVTTTFGFIADNRSASLQAQDSLVHTFSHLSDWPGVFSISLSEGIVRELMLDDYLFRSFGQESNPVTLYIGYYQSAGKVGAAHDPLVCFQGQGWRISDRHKASYQLPDGSHQISYASLVAERLGHRELLIYWFQAGDKTASSTFAQKLRMIWLKLTGGTMNNAFVRISAPLHNDDPENVKEKILLFVNEFYPKFYAYVVGEE